MDAKKTDGKNHVEENAASYTMTFLLEFMCIQ
jgi:hypothetical protein